MWNAYLTAMTPHTDNDEERIPERTKLGIDTFVLSKYQALRPVTIVTDVHRNTRTSLPQG